MSVDTLLTKPLLETLEISKLELENMGIIPEKVMVSMGACSDGSCKGDCWGSCKGDCSGSCTGTKR